MRRDKKIIDTKKLKKNKSLINFYNKEVMGKVVKNWKAKSGHLMEQLEKWELQIEKIMRKFCIQCKGIPLFMWTNKFFRKIM